MVLQGWAAKPISPRPSICSPAPPTYSACSATGP